MNKHRHFSAKYVKEPVWMGFAYNQCITKVLYVNYTAEALQQLVFLKQIVFIIRCSIPFGWIENLWEKLSIKCILECQQYYLLVHFMRKLLIGNIQGQSIKSVKRVFLSRYQTLESFDEETCTYIRRNDLI